MKVWQLGVIELAINVWAQVTDVQGFSGVVSDMSLASAALPAILDAVLTFVDFFLFTLPAKVQVRAQRPCSASTSLPTTHR